PLMAGQLSLASPGFYALGGYVAAVLSTRVLAAGDGPFPLGWLLGEMALAAAASGALAVLVGVPALRLRGIYLALATIAFVEILRVLSLTLEITGGAIGIFGIPSPSRPSSATCGSPGRCSSPPWPSPIGWSGSGSAAPSPPSGKTSWRPA